ncbi:ATP-binding protein [Kingella negevensis]|uniref:ATP-binding protein n=1 Tax=Kingella negevensis TaxID=1522312 RepID=UPI00254A4756|nr:ATP-binding protein [Kingella negevensis]MDK4708014.1 ATP-binding protein [Kingella negevensis]MDK4709574.1 ATP-binding protein [Kingella negevensis]
MAADKKAAQSSSKNAAFMRYRDLIISISVFLVLLVGMLGASIFLARNARLNTQTAEVVNDLQLAVKTIQQQLYALKLSYGEDPNSPHITNTLNNLKDAQSRVIKSQETLRNGGEYTLGDGFTVTINALSGHYVEHLNNIKAAYDPLNADIDNYLKTATSPTATSTPLDLAVLRAQSAEEPITQNVNELYTETEKASAAANNALTTAQGVGVLAAILYLVAFLFYFIRKLVASDQEAEAARRETTEIMDTVNTGLFLLDRDLNIGSQYSKELENLVGQTNLGGKNLLDVLAGLITEDDLNTTHAFIGQLYNPRTKERLIASLNPLNRQPVTLPGQSKNEHRYLDFKFNRVYTEGEITRVLVGVSDVTNAVLLEQKIEQEREQNDVQLEMLSTILQADRRLVDDFVRNVKRRNTNINNTLKAPGERQAELRSKVDTIFREVHSMKGEASTLKLHGFTVLAENLENELNRLGKVATLSGEHFLGLAVHLEELMKLTQTIEDLESRLGGSSPLISGQGAAEEKHTLANYYAKFVSELAERNHKSVDFSYVGIEETHDEDTDSIVREIAVQLLRNAVVHGIETPEERQTKRKLQTGHVRMELTEQDGQYTLVLEDDGKGLDYEAIRAKAVRLGKCTEAEAANLTSKDLLALIFSPGFSTLDKSTEDAGRGVGLDIIKDRISALGGKIGVSTHAGSYTRFNFTFPKKS